MQKEISLNSKKKLNTLPGDSLNIRSLSRWHNDLSMYRTLLSKVALEIGIEPFPEEFSGWDIFLPFLERIHQEGANLLLKIDGERGRGDTGPYTALVSSGPLGSDFFRTDASSMEDALSYIIVEYAQRCWHFKEMISPPNRETNGNKSKRESKKKRKHKHEL